MVRLGIKSLSVYENNKNYAGVMVFILKPENEGRVLTQCWILVIKHERSEAKANRTVLVTWSTSKLFYRVASKTSYDRLGSNLSFSVRRHSPQLSFGQAMVKTWNGAYIPFFDLKDFTDINSINISKQIRFLISIRCCDGCYFIC